MKGEKVLLIVLAGILLIGAGCGEEPMPEPLPQDAPQASAPLPLGSVSTRDTTCRGEPCVEATVSCPRIADATAYMRISGEGSAGTVLLLTGGNGGFFYAASGQNESGRRNVGRIMDELSADGYKLVEVAWRPTSVWEGPAGSITNACRIATLARWAYDDLHDGGLFAAQGNSGGSAQIAFSLAHYGLGDVLDVANVSGGPPPCPQTAEGQINPGEQHKCIVGSETWDGSLEPLFSGTPALSYPDTQINVFVGELEPTEEIRSTARSFYEAVETAKSWHLVPNTAHGVMLTPEGAQLLVSAIRKAAESLAEGR